MRHLAGLGLVLLAGLAFASSSVAGPPSRPAGPVEDGPFLRPAEGVAAEPVWGIKGGIAVGLWPTPGPRGLVRVYAPYLGRPPRSTLNYVAVEPVVKGARGLSELERSQRDGVAGKAMWTSDTLADASTPSGPSRPARGVVSTDGGVRTLSVFIGVEPFENGARPLVEVRLREDRPREVGFRVHAAPGGQAMRSCILTATMGNYARLRRLWLREGPKRVDEVYRPFRPVFMGFAEHRQWGPDDLLVVEGEALVAATTDEADPAGARHGPDVGRGWRYTGRPATQYWRTPMRPGLVARVNARATYWASRAAIPGGPAYENIELEAPFEAGQEFRFGVTEQSPRALGFPAGP